MFEKINSQIEEVKNDKNIGPGDKAGILKVAEYLLTREDMDEKYNNPEKTLMKMWDFIKEEARKKAENNVAVIPDEEVYSIAIHYFDESNEALGIEKEQKKEKSTSKATKTKENIKTFDNASEQPKEEKAEESTPVPEHNDDDIAMIFRGKPVTHKELREGTYLSR